VAKRARPLRPGIRQPDVDREVPAHGGETTIPGSERWLHEAEVRASLDRAVAWAEQNPPGETDLDELQRRLEE